MEMVEGMDKKMNEKKWITEKVAMDIYFSEKTFEKLYIELENYKSKYPDHKNFKFRNDWDYNNNSQINVWADRLETDKEYEKRLAQEKINKEHTRKFKEDHKKKERELYEKLKKKYEEK